LQAKADVVFKSEDNSTLSLVVGSLTNTVLLEILILKNSNDWDMLTGHSRTSNLGAWGRIYAIVGFYQGTNHLFLFFFFQ